MKNVTLSADEDLLDQALLVARSQHKTLNTAFREWLLQYTAQAGGAKELDSFNATVAACSGRSSFFAR